MIWYVAMLVILPLVVWQADSLWSPKLRSWLVVMAASLATYLYQSLPFYTMICLLGTGGVLAYPMTNWQRLLGWTFGVMACLNIGFMLGEFLDMQNFLRPEQHQNALSNYQHGLGWGMFATLLAWGGYDGLRSIGLISGVSDANTADAVEL